jgi:hypothetical protein
MSSAVKTKASDLKSFRRRGSVDWFYWYLITLCILIVASAATRMFAPADRSRSTTPESQTPIIALLVFVGLYAAWRGWELREVDAIQDAGGPVTIRVDLPIPKDPNGYVSTGAVIVNAGAARRRLVDDLAKMWGSIACRVCVDGSLSVDAGRDDEARTRLNWILPKLDLGGMPHTYLERDHSENLEAELPALIAALR